LTSGRPDEELITASRADPAAFAAIFDRHHAQLYRYLRRRVGAALAADLAAETFVIAYARHGADPLADPGAQAAFSMADARADSAAVSAELARILARMPSRDRHVLLLFAWADMSYAEIAQAMNIPVGTVRSRLNRARRELRVLVNGGSLNYLGENHG
jgi:RNA polymerase sigma-70 factor (ECF subfamily)